MTKNTTWVRRAALVSLLIVLLLLAAPANSEPETQAESGAVFMEDSYKREQLLFEEFPIVFSAAKMEQPINWSPSSTTVITADEIRRSSATNLLDLLRRVPGLDIFRVTGGNGNLAVRGFARPASRTVLVLVDGMSVYRDYYGTVEWESLPVVLEEIDRIEIIRGPGSALYGANAFSGVVNIITKTPKQLKGTTVSSTLGQFETYINTVIHAGVKDKWSYRVTGSWTELDSMEFNDERVLKTQKANVLLGYEFDEDQKLTLFNGFIYTDMTSLSHSVPVVWNGISNYLKLNYDHDDWKFQAFYALTDIDTSSEGSIDGYKSLIDNVFDFEVQHTFRPNDEHTVIWGADYRYNRPTAHETFRNAPSFNLFSFFVQDEFRPFDNLAFTGGLRVDSHPDTGVHFSPRFSAVYEPWENHMFRASVGQAFRNPTFIESYLDTTFTYPTPMPGVFVVTNLLGDDDIDAEQVTTFELGYQTRTDDGRLHVKLDTFYDMFDDIIEFVFVSGPTPPPDITFEIDHANVGKAIAYGGELSVDYHINDWLGAYFNYSYEYVEARDDGVQFQDVKKGDRIKSSPRHKVNAGAYAEFDSGVNMSVDASYVDEIEAFFFDVASAVSDPAAIFGHEKVDDYLRVDAKIGYKLPKHDIEVSLLVHNLLNDVHREWAAAKGGERFERQFLINVTGRF